MYIKTIYNTKKCSKGHTLNQKCQKVTNSPIAASQFLRGTPGPPPRVKLWDLDLGMQTQGLRYDRASVQKKDNDNKGII